MRRHSPVFRRHVFVSSQQSTWSVSPTQTASSSTPSTLQQAATGLRLKMLSQSEAPMVTRAARVAFACLDGFYPMTMFRSGVCIMKSPRFFMREAYSSAMRLALVEIELGRPLETSVEDVRGGSCLCFIPGCCFANLPRLLANNFSFSTEIGWNC